ncbi:peroxidase [Parazoarcus communis]|uniref:Peroxidase n=1 Tax=Parazoarcus communis TaxID=41977 RepID=A0A2U8GSE0_9RHOO|nr:Dyp-type peroxidase [Parazoarcus communis]AWI76572.1 peroxidase [Parazoarcus communis]|tara:strand:- start:69565 stop:70449 length:885 start_codon:yes stop_codon:yes gene_type:complete
MGQFQKGILAPLPAQARHLFFAIESIEALPSALDALAGLVDGESTVAGFGESVRHALSGSLDGLRVFPPISGVGVDVPSTQHALWCWLRGEDRGELLHRARAIEAAVAPALVLVQATDTFCYDNGRDLTGYEDGTENPEGDDALAAAFVAEGAGPGAAGGSYVAVQHWRHALDTFAAMPAAEQDNVIGRRRSDNEELDDAPASAHVKRTAQESFEPEAFVLRRSMPWVEGREAGLLFVAFGHSLDAFEAQLRRMAGLDDGITDALFRFSQPTTGGYYWCPPMCDGQMDFRVMTG